MFQKFLNWIRGVIDKMLSTSDIRQATGAPVEISSEMISSIEMWDRLYRNKPDWASNTVIPIGIPAAVAREIARMVTLEAKCEVSGSVRADFLNEQFGRSLPQIRSKVEEGCALGGLVFKPYPTAEGTLAIDIAPPDRFFPSTFDASGRVSSAVFVDRVTHGNRYYTRFEQHDRSGERYTIRNTAFVSYNSDSVGTKCELGEIAEWAELTEEIVFDGIKQPLFGYFRIPLANNIDRDSPLGVSVYARAVELFRQADEQWSRLLWEFAGTELAIDISDRAFRPDENNPGKVVVPKRWERLFRAHGLGDNDRPLYEVFSPQIRESELYKGFQDILRQIEFQCGISYGTLSDPQTVDKTAEEIKMSKQRSYSTVSDIQTALQSALEDLVYAMDMWTSIRKLAPAGAYETSFTWDDSIVVDTDKEFAQRLQMVSAGFLKPESLLAWYFGCSEDKAREMMPQNNDGDPFGLNNNA